MVNKVLGDRLEDSLTKLLVLSKSLITTYDIDSTLELAISLAVDIVSAADRGSLQLLEADGQSLKTVVYNDPDDVIQDVIVFHPNMGIAGHSLVHGETINVMDVLEDERFFQGDLPLRLRSLLVTPLRHNEQLLGTLSLSSMQVGAFSGADEQMIQLIADQVILGLDNARLVTALRSSEMQAKQAEEQVRAYVQNAQDMIYFHGSDGLQTELTIVNATPTGYEARELTVQPDLWRQLIHAADLERMDDFFSAHPEGVPSFEITYRLKHKNGQWRWLQSRQVGVKDEAGHYQGYYCIDRDITAQKQAEDALQEAHQSLEGQVQARTQELAQANRVLEQEIVERKQVINALHESEANLRSILDNTIQAVILFDDEGAILAFNKAAEEVASFTTDMGIKAGQPLQTVMPLERLAEFTHYFQGVLQGQGGSVPWQIQTGEADTWLQFDFQPVLAEDGEVIGGCCSMIDIDYWKKATETLIASEDRLIAQLKSVLSITRALVRETHADTVFELIMTQAEQLVQVDGAAVFLFSDDEDYLRPASPTATKFGLSPTATMRITGSLAEAAIKNQQVKISQYKEQIAPFQTLLHAFELETMLCVPLTMQNTNLGVLVMWSTDPLFFSGYQIQLVNLFADQAALALHNALMYARERETLLTQERHRLARELHDTVTQSLYSISMGARASLKLLEQDRSAAELSLPLQHILTQSKTALIEMREQIHHLSPRDLTDHGLAVALTNHCAQIEKRYKLKIDLQIAVESVLSMDYQVALYYIAREAVWNVLKHTQATQVHIQMKETPEALSLIINDNGAGFDPASLDKLGTMGLRNMEERTQLLGGRFEIQSAPQQGCIIQVHIPTSTVF